MMIWQIIVVAFAAYLIGSINPAIIIGYMLKKEDIRTKGSGNAGTTNVLRTIGKGAAVVVLLLDVFKAVLAILLAKWISGFGAYSEADFALLRDYSLMAASMGVILGHNWPIYYDFKGGKGVATSLGVILMLEWRIGLICLLFALVLIISSRMVSLGSISAAILYPVLVLVLETTAFSNKWLYVGFATILALFVLVRHRANIRRLIDGNENKIWKTKAEKLQEKVAEKAEQK